MNNIEGDVWESIVRPGNKLHVGTKVIFGDGILTAEVLDIETILFVRGKPLDMSIVDMAKNLHINLFQTDETMFEACGKLYKAGMRR